MAERVQLTVEELRLRNFRAFENARLPLSDLTFLVGRNGAGKSSLLDALDLLREAVSDNLENALDRRGGAQKVRRTTVEAGRKSPEKVRRVTQRAEDKPLQKVRRTTGSSGGKLPLGIAVAFRLALAGQRYLRGVYGFELQGEPKATVSHIRECLALSSGETDSFTRTNGLFEASRKVPASPPAGNLVLPLVARADSLWTEVLDAVRNLRSYELSPAHMASAPEIGERSILARDGGNAGDVLKAIKGTEDHRWVVQRLSAITPGITDVRAEALLGRRVLRFVQRQDGYDLNFDASQVSHGTLRGLAVLLALRQRPTPSLVLVDEIENSVHPSGLAVLLDAALASCDRTRVVLTSHSPELLSHPAVTGERVRVVEWRDGTSHVFRLNAETQSAITEIDTVGWMLRSNALWPAAQPETCSGDLFAVDGPEA
jgi:predicted ATPase